MNKTKLSKVNTDRLLGKPESMVPGCKFYTTRFGYVNEYSVMYMIGGGFIVTDGVLKFAMYFDVLNKDPAFKIISYPKKSWFSIFEKRRS